MTPSYEQWDVSGYTRPVFDQDPSGEWWPTGEQERVAVVSDPNGWLWEVVIEGERIASLTVRPPRGSRLTQRTLSATALGYLRDVATTYWRDVDAATADAGDAVNVTPLADALMGASGEAQTGKPTPEEFAQAWLDTPTRQIVGRERLPRRKALTRRFLRPDGTAVSEATIDKWTREARDLGLIEPAKTGAPRTTKTPGGKQPPANGEETQ